MSKHVLLLAVLSTACAARSIYVLSTSPTSYACSHATVVYAGATLETSTGHSTELGWHDEEGAHFVAGPISPTDIDAVEYVIPADPHQDAIQRVYDTSKGATRADWQLVARESCVAHGGYTDALTRFMKGDTLDQVASALTNSDHEQARHLVRTALATLQKQYYRDR
ncbi:MAG: hypothetical protein NT062_12690 [Proteobacteria bacterium]|nr:hypothetical protein [Pseudomonadota bacterium]